MYYVGVIFGSGDKIYWYRTNLSMCVGGKYKIFSQYRDYDTPVTVKYIYSDRNIFAYERSMDPENLVTIVRADCISSAPVPKYRIKVVSFNEPKGVTAVRWEDGTVTKVKCSSSDMFDKEKALALCYMKRWCFDNRGCFNNVFKQYCEDEDNGN